jgi:hypothetical protein
MRVVHVVVIVGALLACKKQGNEQPQPAPDPAPQAPAAPVVVEGPKAETSCARLGAYYTLGGGVQAGGVNISCDGKCSDLDEQDEGAKLKLTCHLNCSAIGTARSKFAGAANVTLDLNRSDKNSDRYSGTISDGKGSPNPVSLTFKQKYDEANGQMTERDMRWSLTLRPCK